MKLGNKKSVQHTKENGRNWQYYPSLYHMKKESLL